MIIGLCCSQPLYIIDCGWHGEYMLDLAHRYNVQPELPVYLLETNLSGCAGPSLDETLLNVTAPARVSLSWSSALAPQRSSFNLNLLLAHRNVTVWAAAGNEGYEEDCDWPASLPNAIAAVQVNFYGRARANGCANKSRVVHVQACYSSEATIIAAAQNLPPRTISLGPDFCTYEIIIVLSIVFSTVGALLVALLVALIMFTMRQRT